MNQSALAAVQGSSRMRSAVFSPIGDEGRAELVDRRISNAISSGVLTHGERLPSEAELARLFGVAVVTAREALMGLRSRGLVVTRRGRNGGSFVIAPELQAMKDSTSTLRAMSRVALRDLTTHYAAISAACVELAATRADDSELDRLDQALGALPVDEPAKWRRMLNEFSLELAALSQSARLTREQLRLQHELTPLLTLADQHKDLREAQVQRLIDLVAAVRARDPETSAALMKSGVREVARWLADKQAELRAIVPVPPEASSLKPSATRAP